MAKNVVAAGLADRFEIELSYAIGIAHPISISIETFGTGRVADERILGLIDQHFDLRPAAIIEALELRQPIYQQTAAYGHFGRPDLDLPWERTDRAPALAADAGVRHARGDGRPGRVSATRRGTPYAVIIAGGGGTRLWPLSDPERPKPFLPLLADGRSLLQHTRGRLAGPGLRLSDDDVFVVTDRRYGAQVRSQLPGIPVIEEPQGRNTAPAVALATLAIERPEEDVMIVLPVDHLMRDEEFNAVLDQAVGDLAPGALGIESPIVTLGAAPTYPATGYGYLVPDQGQQHAFDHGLRAAVLDAFVEKPDRERAERLLAEHPGVAWNAGIFIGRRKTFRSAFERYTPLVTQLAPALSSADALARAYEGLEARSIDYAVMEHAAADGLMIMARHERWLDGPRQLDRARGCPGGWLCRRGPGGAGRGAGRRGHARCVRLPHRRRSAGARTRSGDTELHAADGLPARCAAT